MAWPENMMNATEQTYRKTAADGASGFGLLIALFDTLAGNLRRAAESQRRDDIQQRTDEIKHALLVISYLDDWIDRKKGGELADKLIAFYATMRKKLLVAQAKQSPEMLEEQMNLVLAIRGTWQELEERAASAMEASASASEQLYPGSKPDPETAIFSWSA
jgi:flagellar biosynthetic protein FliS